MPGIDGAAIAARVRERRKFGAVKIVMMSSGDGRRMKAARVRPTSPSGADPEDQLGAVLVRLLAPSARQEDARSRSRCSQRLPRGP